MTTLEREIENGCPNLKGTRIAGRVPISEELANALLTGTPISWIEFREANVIAVKIWSFTITPTIVRVETPLGITLRFPFLAQLFLRMVKGRFPFLRVESGEATINLAAIPQVSKYLKHVRITQLKTYANGLLVNFEISIP